MDDSSRGDAKKANTSTGEKEGRDNVTNTSGSAEVLNWKLSSLDFDRCSDLFLRLCVCVCVCVCMCA